MNVLKLMKIEKDYRGTGLIGRAVDNRIYFIDRAEKHQELIKENDVILAWITKEAEKNGFFRVSVDGKLITDYVSEIPKLTTRDYEQVCYGKLTDIHFLVNYMYNSDDMFKDFVKEASREHIMLKSAYIAEKYIKIQCSNDDYYNLHGVVVKKPLLDSYLYEKYSTIFNINN